MSSSPDAGSPSAPRPQQRPHSHSVSDTEGPAQATISVLITVYHRITPEELIWCLASIHQQTLQPMETVIVLDGPVDGEVRGGVERYRNLHPNTTVVELPENVGSARASNAGLERCGGEWIARLDADDIARPERFAEQMAYLETHPEVDVLGTALAEFADEELARVSLPDGDREPFDVDMGQVAAIARDTRALPETHAKIAKSMRWNSPVNHPSAMIRATALREVGGYHHVPFMEDYDLWARLVAGGYTLHNLPEAWTFFRVSEGMFLRRTGVEMWRAERVMQRNLFRYGLVGKGRAIFNLFFRSLYRALPRPVLRAAYRILFQRRRRAGGE